MQAAVRFTPGGTGSTRLNGACNLYHLSAYCGCFWRCIDASASVQASQAPSKDLSQREIAAAQRLSEHALFLQRRQRAFLARLGAAGARLRSLAATLSDFSAAAEAAVPVPPQVCIVSGRKSLSSTMTEFLITSPGWTTIRPLKPSTYNQRRKRGEEGKGRELQK